MELLVKPIRVRRWSDKWRETEKRSITFKDSSEGRFQKGGTRAGQAVLMCPLHRHLVFSLLCTYPSFFCYKSSSLPLGLHPFHLPVRWGCWHVPPSRNAGLDREHESPSFWSQLVPQAGARDPVEPWRTEAGTLDKRHCLYVSYISIKLEGKNF